MNILGIRRGSFNRASTPAGGGQGLFPFDASNEAYKLGVN
jgi:hypothetical protein